MTRQPQSLIQPNANDDWRSLLLQLLRPAGRGLLTISSGSKDAAPVLKALYDTSHPAHVEDAWQQSWRGVNDANTLLLGVPSDIGAAIKRGAAHGPLGVREAYFDIYGRYPQNTIDLGDIVCVPQLLHDDLLPETLKRRVRRELFPNCDQPLPVSPLSILTRVLATLRTINRDARIILLGGDHSITRPVIDHFVADDPNLAVLQFDAHTDLAKDRFGVDYCFNTWAYHAAKRLQPGRLIQVGIRASTRSKEQWERLQPVAQLWAHEVLANPEAAIETVLEQLRKHNVQRVYVTNDVDGTDPRYTPAVGTREPRGLTPEFIEELVRRIAGEFDVVGGDIVEVAPPLSGKRRYRREPTCRTAANYLHQMLTLPRAIETAGVGFGSN